MHNDMEDYEKYSNYYNKYYSQNAQKAKSNSDTTIKDNDNALKDNDNTLLDKKEDKVQKYIQQDTKENTTDTFNSSNIPNTTKHGSGSKLDPVDALEKLLNISSKTKKS